MSNAIEVKNLTKQFGVQKAVNDASFTVKKGAVCGFLGKNGAGKTTTIKMLVGLSNPTAGKISLLGEERHHGSNNNCKIGYLPDVPNFYGYMTAREYLNFCGKLYNFDDKKLKSRIDDCLKQVSMHDVKKRISTYSRGMKQRLGIAQALINEPEIVFLDEPVSALDPMGRHDIMELIKSLQGTTTIFFSTHILSDVEDICDHILIIEKGKILTDDSMLNLKKKYAENAILIKLFTGEDANKFIGVLENRKEFSFERINPSEIIVRSDNVYNLSKQMMNLLAESDNTLESFRAYTPSLENIFMEVTKNA